MANYRNIEKAKSIEKTYKEMWLRLEPKLDDESGIYFLVRYDENGFKYAYIGQAKHILSRLAQHMVGYQHIDLSLKSHKLFDEEKNPYGWKVGFIHCPISELDEKEQEYIKKYADAGFQLRNKNTGGNLGKAKIDEYRPARGYYDGIAQGKISLARELRHIIDLHLDINVKKGTKTAQKQYEKFMYLIDENTYKKD